MLMPGNASRREILFVSDRNPEREHWNGRLLSRAEAADLTGIRTVLGRNQFEPFIARDAQPAADRATSTTRKRPRSSRRWAPGRARVGLALQAGGIADPLSPPQDFARRIRERYVGFQAIDVTSDPDGSAPDQDAVRAQGPGQEPRHLQRGADGRHAGRPSWRMGVPSRGGDRSGASIARRGVVELPVDRRQRSQRHDPALHREQPADASRGPAARRCRRPTTSTCPATSPGPIRSAAVHAAAEGHLRHRPAGAGRGDEGGPRRAPRCCQCTTRPWRSSRPAC